MATFAHDLYVRKDDLTRAQEIEELERRAREQQLVAATTRGGRGGTTSGMRAGAARADAFELARTLQDRALGLREGMSDVLTSGEASPFESMHRTLEKAQADIANLAALASGPGLHIQPRNSR